MGSFWFTRYRGHVTVEELWAVVAARSSDPSIASATLHLIDMEEAEITVTSADVQAYVDFLRTTSPLPSVERTASVVSRDLTYGFSRMLELSLEAKGVERTVRPFRTLADAVAWLGVDEVSTRSFLEDLWCATRRA